MTSVVQEPGGVSVKGRSSISVAMAVFNGARFLRTQLDSIASQALPPDELVVVDDASEDGSLAIIEEFGNAAPFPVQLLRNATNQGSTQSFERALVAARSDFVALADQDDVWYPQKLDVLSRHLTARPDAMLALSDARLINESGAVCGGTLWSVRPRFSAVDKYLARDPFVALMSRQGISGATALFRRAVVEAATPFPPGMPFLHDGWLEIVAASLGRVIVEAEPLMDYRTHLNQQLGVRIEEAEAMRSVRERLGSPVQYQHRLDRIFAVEKWLGGAPVPEQRRDLLIAEIREYRQHLGVRSSLPPRLHQRLLLVSRELATGRYRRWSYGAQSAVKDLTGPRVDSPSVT